MRAVVLETYGEPDVLSIQEVPEPEPGPDEVVVDVVATALNRADLAQRRGFYPGPPMDREIPGLEFAGRVSASGPGASAWSEGAEVMAIVAGGAYAERIAVHERQLLPVPTTVGITDAAAIPESWITAFDALVVQGGLTSGRTALVHAGASGVGTAAIQVAHAVGARVVATASAGKVEACRELGADLVVDYTVDDFVTAAWEATSGDGVDVVLDVVGGDYLDRNVSALRTGGTIVQVGVMGGGEVSFNLGALMSKRATLIGTLLRPRPVEEKIAISQRFGEEILPLFDTGELHPVIDRRFPLDAIADAHRYMESNANIGKVLIDLVA